MLPHTAPALSVAEFGTLEHVGGEQAVIVRGCTLHQNKINRVGRLEERNGTSLLCLLPNQQQLALVQNKKEFCEDRDSS